MKMNTSRTLHCNFLTFSLIILVLCGLVTVSFSSASSFSLRSAETLPNGWVWGCRNISSTLPFCQYDIPTEERVSDLLSRLTLEEKLGLLGADNEFSKVGVCNCMDHGVPRLGIPAYMNLVEVNTAVASACISEGVCATEFVSPAGLAASFNRSLWRAKGEVISSEQRAFANYGWWRGTYDKPYSKIALTGFGPNINIVRDPRFGRNSELPSEDPYLTGSYATEYVRGMQEGPDSRYLKMIAGLKHFTAYSVETNREGFIPNISSFDLWDTYFAQYKMAFSQRGGNAQAVMCSYSGVNGVPSCANNFLLNNVIRGLWRRDDVLVVTDCGAINNMIYSNHYAKDDLDAASKTLNGGSDVDLGDTFFSPFGGNGALSKAITMNMTDERRVNAAVRRVLTVRFRAGLFDPLERQVYTKIGIDVINSTAHQSLNLDAALQSLVLLKNEGKVLPLKTGKKLAVLGPHVYSTRDLIEDYKGDQQCFDGTYNCIPTIADVFQSRNGQSNTKVVKGVELSSNDTSGVSEALRAASEADQVILFMGLGNAQEYETHDRTDIKLPGIQEQFALKVLSLGKPTVVVLINGGMLAIDNLIPKTQALIEAFYPSVAGAEALYKAIFGLSNRWGKMPVTIYPYSFQQKQSLTDFDMTKSPGRTYRYYTDNPLFPFGFGLSYTSFSIDCSSYLPLGPDANDAIVNINCLVQNKDNMDGDEVLMVYHRVSDSIRKQVDHPVPINSLIQFDRVSLRAFDVVPVAITLSVEQLAITNSRGDKVLYAGDHMIEVGDGVVPPYIFTITIGSTKTFPSS